MAATESKMLELGTPMPSFALRDVTSGATIDRESLLGAPVVVAFICNHCPYVIHIRKKLAEVGRSFMNRGVRMVAISSNDVEEYPADAPDQMVEEAKNIGYPFPYLYDESQDVARAFGAACTPDFFVYDRTGVLAYRGQFDASRPKNAVPVTGVDLCAAVDALVAGQRPSVVQRPSLGCNIKWKD